MKTLKKSASLMLALQLAWVAPAAHAREILYRGGEQTEDEFNGLKIARPDAIAYDDYQLENLLPKSMRAHLTATFARAQEHFLKSEIAQIAENWREVTSFAYKADWEVAQRRMIQTAFFRLAQMAETPEKTTRLLREALHFDPTYRPEPQLYPPPLVDQYEILRSRLELVRVPTTGWEGYTVLLVNGVRYSLENRESVEVPEGVHRFQFISPRYQPVVRVLDSKELPLLPLEKITARSAPSTGLAALAPQTHPAHEPIENVMKTELNEKPFYAKPKFWIVTAALGGAIWALQSFQKKEDGQKPTHREGF